MLENPVLKILQVENWRERMLRGQITNTERMGRVIVFLEGDCFFSRE